MAFPPAAEVAAPRWAGLGVGQECPGGGWHSLRALPLWCQLCSAPNGPGSLQGGPWVGLGPD
eukprot:8638825-Alexandrium_andersonii.AAC.1